MPKALAAGIAQSLRQRIECGEWTTAQRLPNERELAAEYKVARNTLRRAIGRIAVDGMVSREVGRGTFLCADPQPDLVGVMRKLVGVSPMDMMAARRIVEPKAAALAATNASLSDLETVAAAHERAVNAEAFEPFEQCDADFHELIFVASRNELLAGLHAILKFIRNQDQWLGIKRRSFSAERRAEYCGEHAAIVEALLRRDAEAAERAMLTHLGSVGQNLFNAY